MARREPHWVKLFLRELERTGNVRISAERAGVDHTSAYQRRRRHAGFAERWEASVAAFRAAPSPSHRQGDGSLPPLRRHSIGADAPTEPGGRLRPRGERGSEEMVVHPDGKLIRAGPGRWNRTAERTFLAKLAETANVRQSAKAAGFSTVTIGARRLKDPHFDEACRAAIEVGKAALEAMLVEWGQRRFDPEALPLSDQQPQVTVAEAISIIKLKRNEPGPSTSPGSGPGLRPTNGGGTPRVASEEEVRQALVKGLKAFGARTIKQYREAGWAEHDLPPGPWGEEDEEPERVWLPPGWRLAGPEEGVEATSTGSGQG